MSYQQNSSGGGFSYPLNFPQFPNIDQNLGQNPTNSGNIPNLQQQTFPQFNAVSVTPPQTNFQNQNFGNQNNNIFANTQTFPKQNNIQPDQLSAPTLNASKNNDNTSVSQSLTPPPIPIVPPPVPFSKA